MKNLVFIALKTTLIEDSGIPPCSFTPKGRVMCGSSYASLPYHELRAGDRVRFKHYGLGKLVNIFLELEGVKVYGWGPFDVVSVDSHQAVIKNGEGKEGPVDAFWLKRLA